MPAAPSPPSAAPPASYGTGQPAPLTGSQGVLGETSLVNPDFSEDAFRSGVAPPAPAPPVVATPAPVASPEPPTPTHDGTPAGAFVAWCRSGDGLMDRAYRFAEASGFEVKAVQRECNALGLEFAAQPRDPAEYWLVRDGMEHLLFPQPQSPRTFREVHEALFDASCNTPGQLSVAEPCRVELEGASLRVKARGRLA